MIIDPPDGTTNYLHGFPQYAVSIALAHKETVTQAVVYDPSRNDLFIATRGRGAFLNETRMRVSKRAGLAGSLMGTGFPFRQHDHMETYLAMLREVMTRTAGARRAARPASILQHVAAGALTASGNSA
jgi:myo-inositol-1(or 4)-monophosphatase